MTTPLFSTYRQGENRVTATFLAVLQRLSLPNIDRILSELLDNEFHLATFINQPQPRGTRSIPDAKITTAPGIWIETKTSPNAVRTDQVSEHLKALDSQEQLLLLTPDVISPTLSGLADTEKDRVTWANFLALSKAIRTILDDKDSPPSEDEAFLLRELIAMLAHDGLLRSDEQRVLVVGAREGWPMYKEFGLYWCLPSKPMREFQPGDYMAFYAEQAIQPLVPRINGVLQSANLSQDAEDIHEKILLEQIRRKLVNRRDHFQRDLKYMLLSSPEESETVRLPHGPIMNDKQSESGKRVAFVQGARYVTLASLKEARSTSELKPC